MRQPDEREEQSGIDERDGESDKGKGQGGRWEGLARRFRSLLENVLRRDNEQRFQVQETESSDQLTWDEAKRRWQIIQRVFGLSDDPYKEIGSDHPFDAIEKIQRGEKYYVLGTAGVYRVNSVGQVFGHGAAPLGKIDFSTGEYTGESLDLK
jgi:hypothetical protein